MNGEFLFEAIGHVGADLVDSAEQKTFSLHPWRKWGAWAACLALLLCAAAALPKLLPTEQTPVEVLPAEQQVQLLDGAMFHLNGYLYYVDDYAYAAAGYAGTPFTQTQLQEIASAVPLNRKPEWVSSDKLEQAVLYEADVQTAQQLGQPIEPQSLVLALEDGLHLAYSYGEIPGLQYTYDKAAAASHQTLLELFVLPLENQFSDDTLQFSSASDLNEAQLHNLFRGILAAEDASGIRSLEAERKQRQRDCTDASTPMVYSAEAVQQKLDRYFYGCVLHDTDPLEITLPGSNGITAQLLAVDFRQETQNMELHAALYYGETCIAEKVYTVQFTSDGYRYLSIVRTSAP